MKPPASFTVNAKRGGLPHMPIVSVEAMGREDIGYVERYVKDA
jgi:hypothetical protein